jgi:hypothetical protein
MKQLQRIIIFIVVLMIFFGVGYNYCFSQKPSLASPSSGNFKENEKSVTELLTVLPYFEDFSSGVLPDGWSIETTTGSPDWQIGNFSNGLSPVGTYAPYAYLPVDRNNAVTSALITHAFDFTIYTDINISFAHKYVRHNNGSASLSYSLNGGASWSNIMQWSSSVSQETYTSNIISHLAGQPSAIFRFLHVYNGGGKC